MTTQTLDAARFDRNLPSHPAAVRPPTRPLARGVDVAPPAARPAAGATLDGHALCKSFGGREVLRDIDLQVTPGEFVAVVGRSGCGKSTLLRLLAGLEAPDAGRVHLDGAPLAQRQGEIRIMFQEARLLPWKSVLDNVALGLRSGDARRWAHEVLGWVGLADRADEWPAVLSGGQRQRVALARALVHRPRLLLLDEPLGALDALTRIEMQRLIESLWRRQRFSAVMVTHDVAEAVAMADRIVLIDDQRVALDERVRLERPRARGSAAFGGYEDTILQRLLGRPPAPDPTDGLDFGVPAMPLRFAV